MSFPKYPNYKPSGVEWLGDVPAHWEVRRLGYFFRERREKVSDREFEPLSVTMQGIVPRIDTAAKTDDGDNRKKVCIGDFVINSRSDRKGSAGVSSISGSVSLISTVLEPKSEIVGAYIHHLLRSVDFQEEYYRYGKGIVADLWSTNYSEMRNISLAIPPKSEQAAIAWFLNQETGKIDSLVAEQRRLIELLKEKRQAVISHAVTKGLNPHAPMKPSGIEWLGDVPEHWSVVRLGRLCTDVADGPHFSPKYVDDSSGGIPFLSARNVKVEKWDFDDVKYVSVEDCDQFDRRVIPQRGDVLYTKGGTTGIARVVDLPYRFQVWVHIAVLKIFTGVAIPEFVAMALNSSGSYEQSQLFTRGATNQDLGLTRMVQILLALPPLNEQTVIIKHLQVENLRLETLTTEAERAIALLQERRTALISAAVTGKIDVRSFAPTEAGACA